MTTIHEILKSEIVRLSRKQLRTDMAPMKKAMAAYRSEIAALKARVSESDRALRTIQKHIPKPASPPLASESGENGSKSVRFSAKAFAKQRQRLELSAADCALMFGTSVQTIYNWEAGTSRPRGESLTAIAAMKKLGKRDTAAILETLKTQH